MLTGYEYHLFISYPRSGDVSEWVLNHFLPRLANCLESTMSDVPRIFVDEEVETGSDWPQKLADALHRSCCLLTVWTPPYFRSKWCMAEWQTFLSRERNLGFKTSENPSGLVYPVVFSDGDYFPDEAKRTQSRRDLIDCTYPQPQFRNVSKYLEFHDKVGKIAHELDQWLVHVPPWDPNWQPVRPDPLPPYIPRFARL